MARVGVRLLTRDEVIAGEVNHASVRSDVPAARVTTGPRTEVYAKDLPVPRTAG
jgi:hypothetical protein